MNPTIQRVSLGVASLFMMMHVSLSAKKCKTFGSLVVKCALNAGSLSVNNNVTIGGNLSVSGTITTTSGSLGDVFAYGSWSQTTIVPAITQGSQVPFATNIASTPNITANGAGTVFTINLAGTYLILYQVVGIDLTGGNTATLLLQSSTNGGVTFSNVPGAGVFVSNGGTGVLQEASSAVIVPSVAAGTQFQVINSSGSLAEIEPTASLQGSDPATITFMRIHA